MSWYGVTAELLEVIKVEIMRLVVLEDGVLEDPCVLENLLKIFVDLNVDIDVGRITELKDVTEVDGETEIEDTDGQIFTTS